MMKLQSPQSSFFFFFSIFFSFSLCISITDCTDLQSISSDLNGAHILTKNIDCQGNDFIPIGNTTHFFMGSLDGQGWYKKIIFIPQNQK